MSKIPERSQDGKTPARDTDDDINVEEIVKIIAPQGAGDDDDLRRAMRSEGSGKGEPVKAAGPAKIGNPTTTGNPTGDKPKTVKAEEESVEKLASKIDEVQINLDDLSKGIVQVNEDLRNRVNALTAEMNRLANSLKEATQAIEQARTNIQSATPSSLTGQRQEQPPYAPPPTQQLPPQQTYQAQSYGYQSPQPTQQQYPQRPPQQGYYQQPPPQQGYYSQQQPPQQGFFQPQKPPPPPPGSSPEEAVTKGTESLRGTVFDDVVSAFGQVASIVFSRLLDAREKIMRIDPSFPVQEFEPVLSELRANPRMKLSQVDKRKLIDRMLFWASRLPRQP